MIPGTPREGLQRQVSAIPEKTVLQAAEIRSAFKESQLLADSMPSLTDLDDDFLVFVSLILKGETPVPPEATQDEWRSLLSILNPHGIVPLLYWHVCSLGIKDQLPQDTVQLLRTAFLASVRRNTLAKRQLAEIISAFEGAGINPLVLKGAALAESVYPDPATRPTGDIDLLVLPHHMAGAREVLGATGYRCKAGYFDASEDLYCQEEFIPVGAARTRVGVDLHWRVHRFLGVTDRPRTEDLLERAVPVDSSSGTLKTLNTVDSLVHSAFHACLNHNRSMRLVWICDIALLARQLRAPGDWKLLQTRSVDWCARLAVEDCLKMAQTWCGLKIPCEFSDFAGWPAPTGEERTLFCRQSLKKERSLDVLRLHWPRSLSPTGKAKALLSVLFPPLDILRSRYPMSGKWQIPLRYLQRWSSWLTRGFTPATRKRRPVSVSGTPANKRPVRSSASTFLQFFGFLRPYWKQASSFSCALRR